MISIMLARLLALCAACGTANTIGESAVDFATFRAQHGKVGALDAPAPPDPLPLSPRSSMMSNVELQSFA